MKFGDLLPLIGAGVGTAFGNPAAGYAIGSAGKGLVSGSGQQGGSKSSNTYIPTGLGDADQTFQQILQQIAQAVNGAGGAISPELAKAFQAMLGSGAGDQYSNLAGQAGQAGDFLRQLGLDVGGAGRQLWETSLDPQNQLRDTLQQRTVDAARAGDSSRGIGMSPESAGVENKAVNDFLMNWENNRLNRQATGLTGFANASNQAGRNMAGGLAAGQLQPEYTLQGAGVPFQAAGQYTGAMSGLNQQYGGLMSQIIQYLNQGNAATGQGFSQGQTGINNAYTGLGQIPAGSMDWLTRAFSGAPMQDPSTGSYGDPWAQGGFGT